MHREYQKLQRKTKDIQQNGLKCKGDGKHTQQDKGNTIYGKCNAVQANTLKRAGNTSKSSQVKGQRSEMSTVEREDGASKRGVG